MLSLAKAFIFGYIYSYKYITKKCCHILTLTRIYYIYIIILETKWKREGVETVMCEECVRYIANRLSNDAVKIFLQLAHIKKPMLNKTEIQEVTGLTYTRTQMAVRELEGSTLIETENIGSANYVRISPTGRRLKKIVLEEEKQKEG